MGMRRRSGLAQWITLPALQKFLCVGEHLGFAFVVRRWKIDECLAQYSAHARGLRLFGNGVLEVIHVGERGYARANLFRRSQPRSPANEILIHVLRFGGKDVLVASRSG